MARLKPLSSNGYSADVRIELLIDGQSIPVAQAGGDRLVFRQPVSFSTPYGELLMRIDGHEQRWRVALRTTTQPERVIAAELFTSQGNRAKVEEYVKSD